MSPESWLDSVASQPCFFHCHLPVLPKLWCHPVLPWYTVERVGTCQKEGGEGQKMGCCCVSEALLKLHILYIHMHRGRVEEKNTKTFWMCVSATEFWIQMWLLLLNFMTSCTQKSWFPLKVPCRNFRSSAANHYWLISSDCDPLVFSKKADQKCWSDAAKLDSLNLLFSVPILLLSFSFSLSPSLVFILKLFVLLLC